MTGSEFKIDEERIHKLYGIESYNIRYLRAVMRVTLQELACMGLRAVIETDATTVLEEHSDEELLASLRVSILPLEGEGSTQRVDDRPSEQSVPVRGHSRVRAKKAGDPGGPIRDPGAVSPSKIENDLTIYCGHCSAPFPQKQATIIAGNRGIVRCPFCNALNKVPDQ